MLGLILKRCQMCLKQQRANFSRRANNYSSTSSSSTTGINTVGVAVINVSATTKCMHDAAYKERYSLNLPLTVFEN